MIYERHSLDSDIRFLIFDLEKWLSTFYLRKVIITKKEMSTGGEFQVSSSFLRGVNFF